MRKFPFSSRILQNKIYWGILGGGEIKQTDNLNWTRRRVVMAVGSVYLQARVKSLEGYRPGLRRLMQASKQGMTLAKIKILKVKRKGRDLECFSK